jgi:chromosome segregation ATPase
MHTVRAVPILVAGLVVGIAGSALAQVQRSSSGASAQLMQQYQQVASERTTLQGENAKLKKDLEDAKKERASLTQQIAALRANANGKQGALAAAQAANASTAQTLEQTKAKLQELVARFREMATTLRDTESDRNTLKGDLAASRADFDHCAEHNLQLYDVNREILDRYEHQSTFGVLARSEPFTRIKRTQIENLVDEYRTRAQELQVQKHVQGETPAASPSKNSP